MRAMETVKISSGTLSDEKKSNRGPPVAAVTNKSGARYSGRSAGRLHILLEGVLTVDVDGSTRKYIYTHPDPSFLFLIVDIANNSLQLIRHSSCDACTVNALRAVVYLR